jgi:hypothetical protein
LSNLEKVVTPSNQTIQYSSPALGISYHRKSRLICTLMSWIRKIMTLISWKGLSIFTKVSKAQENNYYKI